MKPQMLKTVFRSFMPIVQKEIVKQSPSDKRMAISFNIKLFTEPKAYICHKDTVFKTACAVMLRKKIHIRNLFTEKNFVDALREKFNIRIIQCSCSPLDIMMKKYQYSFVYIIRVIR